MTGFKELSAPTSRVDTPRHYPEETGGNHLADCLIRDNYHDAGRSLLYSIEEEGLCLRRGSGFPVKAIADILAGRAPGSYPTSFHRAQV